MPKVTVPQSAAVRGASFAFNNDNWPRANTAANRSSFEHDGTWSLAMIVKDEANVLGRVLEDVAGLCEEMVVVDTGSSDDTKAIATAHGAIVFDFEWTDDFAAARNFSFAHCHGEWILWLDADDRLPPDSRAALEQLKAELRGRPDIGMVKLRYHYTYDPNDPDVCIVSQERGRLVRRELGTRWRGAIHETLPIPAQRMMRYPQAWVEHRPSPEHGRRSAERNLSISERQIEGGDRTPTAMWQRARSLQGLGRWEDALHAYQGCVQQFEGSGLPGWVTYEALESMAVCCERLGRQEDKYQYLLRAADAEPTRAECLVRLGVHHYERQEWAQAVPFFEKATQLTPPPEGAINDEAYGWWPWDYLAISYNGLGMYEEALKATDEALRTSTDRDRLLANKEFYLRQVQAKEQTG